MKSSVAIRVNADSTIGLGHFSRCLTLSEELIRRGIEVHIVSHTLPPDWEHYALSAGVILHLLVDKKSGYQRDETPRALDESDAQQTVNILTTNGIEILIVDCYQITDVWAEVAAQNARLIILDDGQNVNIECAIRIDFAMTENSAISGRNIFCGPRFSLIHPSYRVVSQSQRVWQKTPQDIFVYLGATYQPNTFTQVLELVGRSLRHGNSVSLLSSDFLRYGNLTDDWRRQIPLNVVRDSRTLADTFQCADFAIGAAGMSSMERACAGVPSLQLILTKNQCASAAWLQREGAAECLEVSRLKDSESDQKLSSLLNNLEQLEKMSNNGKRLVDGLGALRVAELINPTNLRQVVMRNATAEDIWTFFDWTNDPTARQNSLQTETVNHETHRRWFQEQLTSTSVELVLFELSELPVSQLRLTKADGDATISYSVDIMARGRGLGMKMIQDLVQRERGTRRFKKLKAVVKHENESSLAIFKATGFSAIRSSKSEIHLEIEV